MPDIAIHWSPSDGRGDWRLDGADLSSGQDIQTAVIISLFTDARAGPDDALPDGVGDRRGWWGDHSEFSAGATASIGSRLWLLDRSKRTDATLLTAKAYIAEALRWLIDDGVVARVAVDAAWLRTGALAATVTLYKPDAEALVMRFANVWEGTL